MAMYDEDWRKLEEWRADLKVKEAEKKQPAKFIIKMDSYEKMVPESEKKKDQLKTAETH